MPLASLLAIRNMIGKRVKAEGGILPFLRAYPDVAGLTVLILLVVTLSTLLAFRFAISN